MERQNSPNPDQTHDSMVEGTQKRAKYSKKQITLSRNKRRLFKHVWLARTVVIAIVVACLLVIFYLAGRMLVRSSYSNYFLMAKNFVLAPSEAVESYDGRTNILILGKSGLGNDSPDLTDTIILASININNPSITLISLPRDIWIPSIRAKLNSAYYWGEQKESGGGVVLVKSLAEEIIGVPVEYALVIDFSGFKEIVDVLGGVDVEVEQSFTDNYYPIAGRENDDCDGDRDYKCRYEAISFEKGVIAMDGETALKFVRSRNADGDEGTDIAREARQQKVILAIKNKILSSSTLLSPKKMSALYETVRNSVKTDIPSSAGAVLTRKIFSAQDKMHSYVIPEEYLYNPPISSRYDNLYVFLPADGDWQAVQEWVKTKFE